MFGYRRRSDPASCLYADLTVCKIKDVDEREQIAYSSGPFRASEAYRDACRSTRRTRDYSQVQDANMHFFLVHQISLSLSLTLYVFPAPTFQTLVFCHLELSVSYHRPSSPWTWRVCACTVFVSYHQSALLISPPFYAQDFSLFPRLLSACFYFSTVAHNKVLHRLVLLQGH